VERAEGVYGFRHQGYDLGALGDVGCDSDGFAAEFLDLGDDLVDAGLVCGDVVDADIIAIRCKPEGDGFAAGCLGK